MFFHFLVFSGKYWLSRGVFIAIWSEFNRWRQGIAGRRRSAAVTILAQGPTRCSSCAVIPVSDAVGFESHKPHFLSPFFLIKYLWGGLGWGFLEVWVKIRVAEVRFCLRETERPRVAQSALEWRGASAIYAHPICLIPPRETRLCLHDAAIGAAQLGLNDSATSLANPPRETRRVMTQRLSHHKKSPHTFSKFLNRLWRGA